MRGRVAAAAMVLLTSAATLFSQGQGGGFVAYPERRPGEPAAIERGRAAYGVNCVFCHGIDARGGDGGHGARHDRARPRRSSEHGQAHRQGAYSREP